jgi:hypothetical protein
VLKKKEWKGLVGHPCDRGKCGIFSFFFSALYFLVFFFCHFILLPTAINLSIFVPMRKDCC